MEEDLNGARRRFLRPTDRLAGHALHSTSTRFLEPWPLPETSDSGSDLELTTLHSRDSEELLNPHETNHGLDTSKDEASLHMQSINPSPSIHDVQNSSSPYPTEPAKQAKPAKVATRQRRKVLLSAVQYHLPALVLAILLTILYALEIAWPFTEAPTVGTAQAGIQFLAQVHETFVVLSLSQLVLHRIRYHLLQENGVELGLLYANFRLSNALYCFSKEFFGAVRKSYRSRATLGTVAFTVLASAISVALSPLSAILLTPQPRISALSMSDILSRKLPSALDEGMPSLSDVLELQLAIREQDLWPLSIGPALGVNWSCVSIDSETNDPCPGLCPGTPSVFNLEYETIMLSVLNQATALGNSFLTLRNNSYVLGTLTEH